MLRALSADEDVTSILGLARRPPVTSAAPYADVEWAAVDIAEGEHVIEHLTELFDGADAVIHLGWQLQPNTRRDQLREVNVDGTRRVAQAVGRAGVEQFLVASSWAVYSPDPDKQRRTEDWPAGGVPSSHYSVDKAAQEHVLDTFSEQYPDVQVARMRTALVFQKDAGAAITRYFIGPFVPPSLLRPNVLPLLPLPTGLQVQVVHADDAAAAYLTVLHERAHGAFNVAAEPVLGVAELGELVGRGRTIEVPWQPVRTAVYLGHSARMVAADASWLDMARELPLMDTSRIRDLGWEPRYSAEDTLLELLDGLAAAAGTPTPVMVSGVRSFGHLDEAAAATMSPQVWRPRLPEGYGRPGVPEHVDSALLGLYLSDHRAGATAGRNRIRQMAQEYAATRIGPELARISAEIDGEHTFYGELLDALGVHERSLRQLLGGVAEQLGRLKMNRRLLQTSPMTPLLELELMRNAVIGKRSGWQVLATYADDLGLPQELFTDLAERADRQEHTLDQLHQQVRIQALYTVGDGVA